MHFNTSSIIKVPKNVKPLDVCNVILIVQLTNDDRNRILFKQKMSFKYFKFFIKGFPNKWTGLLIINK